MEYLAEFIPLSQTELKHYGAEFTTLAEKVQKELWGMGNVTISQPTTSGNTYLLVNMMLSHLIDQPEGEKYMRFLLQTVQDHVMVREVQRFRREKPPALTPNQVN